MGYLGITSITGYSLNKKYISGGEKIQPKKLYIQSTFLTKTRSYQKLSVGLCENSNFCKKKDIVFPGSEFLQNEKWTKDIKMQFLEEQTPTANVKSSLFTSSLKFQWKLTTSVYT